MQETVSIRETGHYAKDSLDQLMPDIYRELKRVAANLMQRERYDHTLQPTALVNEAYMRLMSQHSVNFGNRAQVIGIAAQMMRRILCTHEEGRSASKRGGELTILCLEEAIEPGKMGEAPFSAIDQMLERLANLDQRQAMVAELRIFGGLTVHEIADFLDISAATVSRDWSSGKLWLARELRR